MPRARATKAVPEKEMLRELKQLAYTYGINSVIRFAKTRNEEHKTQSVGEHVANILACAYFFKDKVKGGDALDMGLVARRILIHDMGEIETGDIVTVKRANDSAERDMEHKAIRTVTRKVPKALARTLMSDYESTEDGLDFEGRFVRAMDKFEGLFFCFVGAGIPMIRTVTPEISIRRTYIAGVEKKLVALGFPEVARYARVAGKDMVRRGYLRNKD